MKFTRAVCGEEHEEWPALGFNEPEQYAELTEEERVEKAELKGDFCIIRHEDQTDRFIRAVLVLPVNDAHQYLEYGVWVSLSNKSFAEYMDNYTNPDYEAEYFGWLCNTVAGYENSLSVKTTVCATGGLHRPYILPHEGQDHPLVHDFYNGITEQEALRRIGEVIKVKSLSALTLLLPD